MQNLQFLRRSLLHQHRHRQKIIRFKDSASISNDRLSSRRRDYSQNNDVSGLSQQHSQSAVQKWQRRHQRLRMMSSSTDGHESLSSSTKDANSTRASPHNHNSHHGIPYALEKFTSKVLNANGLPLGTMTSSDECDMYGAIEAWLNIGGGYALDSAERLLDRLILELAVMDPILVRYQPMQQTVFKIQESILQLWLEQMKDHPNSTMALQRSERALTSYIKLSKDSSDLEQTPLTTHIYTEILDGWLRFQTQSATYHASQILLRLTNDIYNLDNEYLGPILSPYFNQTIIHLTSASTDNTTDESILDYSEFIQRMEVLSRQPEWSDLQIQKQEDHTKDATLEASLAFQNDDYYNPQIQQGTVNDTKTDFAVEKAPAMSSFELEAIETRMIGIMANHDATKLDGDQTKKLETYLSKLGSDEEMRPSDKLIQHLVEFYVRVSNPGKASYWLTKFDDKSLLRKYFVDDCTLFDDMIQAWLNNGDKRAPWKADETFREAIKTLKDGDDHNIKIHTGCFQSMFQIWTDSQDPSAGRKIQELDVLMTEMSIPADSKSIALLLENSVRQRNTTAAKKILQQIFEGWDNYSNDEKQLITETVISVAAETNLPMIAMKILLRMNNEDTLQLTDAMYQSFLKLISSGLMKPVEVVRLVDVLTESSKSNDNFKFHLDLSLHRTAILSLMEYQSADVAKDVDLLYTQALDIVRSEKMTIDKLSVEDFLSDVIAKLASPRRKLYVAAEKYLIQAESTLLDDHEDTTTEAATDKFSLIPLECYRRVIQRKWYTESITTSISTFSRMLKYYNAGYTNLKPDGDIIESYIRASVPMKREDPNEIDSILDDVVQAIGGDSSVLIGVGAPAYSAILLGYRKQSDLEAIAQKSISLLGRMIDHGTVPNTRALNLVMQNVQRGEGPDAFGNVLHLFNHFQTYDVEPDYFSYQILLEACLLAEPVDFEEALSRCLETLAVIRHHSTILVSDLTYTAVFRILTQVDPSGSQGDKVLAAVLNACREDGFLKNSRRNQLQRQMSESAWEYFYTSKLLADGTQPVEWTRNMCKKEIQEESVA